MMYQWSLEMRRFMEDASRYGDYYRRLADLVCADLRPEDHVCDAGCGLGYLSRELAARQARVTAVDVNGNVLQRLREDIQRLGLSNLTVRQGDIEALLPSEPYDAMVFCFFGPIENALRVAAAQCSGAVTIISKNYENHRFSVEKHRIGSDIMARSASILTESGIPFEKETLELEFGQPFRSREDARQFFRIYSRDEDPGLITDAFLDEKLTVTGRDDFPYYLPHLRKLGIIRFQSRDIPGEAK